MFFLPPPPLFYFASNFNFSLFVLALVPRACTVLCHGVERGSSSSFCERVRLCACLLLAAIAREGQRHPAPSSVVSVSHCGMSLSTPSLPAIERSVVSCASEHKGFLFHRRPLQSPIPPSLSLFLADGAQSPPMKRAFERGLLRLSLRVAAGRFLHPKRLSESSSPLSLAALS